MGGRGERMVRVGVAKGGGGRGGVWVRGVSVGVGGGGGGGGVGLAARSASDDTMRCSWAEKAARAALTRRNDALQTGLALPVCFSAQLNVCVSPGWVELKDGI